MKRAKIVKRVNLVWKAMTATVVAVTLSLVFWQAEPVSASDREAVDYGEEGDYGYIVYSDGSVSLYEYSGSDTELHVPATIGGMQVTEVDLRTIRVNGVENITKVSISEGVKKLLLNGFSSLKNLELPSTLTEIEALQQCSSLSALQIPDNVSKIGDWAFNGCLQLTTVNIPVSLTTISRYMFSGSSIQYLKIPGTVKTIEGMAFYMLQTLKSVEISSGVQVIGDYAFQRTGLTSVTIPGTVTRIGKEAFEGCYFLSSMTLQNGVGRIEESAFWGCKALQTVTIPGSVGIIGNKVFWGCDALKTVVVQEGVTQMGSNVFTECKNLTTLTLPASLSSIGYSLVPYGGKTKVICPANSYAYQYAVQNGYINNVSGSSSLARDPFPTGNWTIVSGGIYESLGNGKVAFKSPLSKLSKSVTIKDSITVSGKKYRVIKINAKAFSGCKKMKKITVKATGLTKVGSKAFKGIHKRAVIKVPKKKLKAYKKLFKDKGQAKSVKIKK